MTNRLPDHTLMVTYLNDAITRRRITVEHLADLMCPVSKHAVRSWLAGWSAPSASDLEALATALHINPIELTCGWLIDAAPELERVIRTKVLDPMGSAFPRSDHYALRAPRPRASFSVGDPHEVHETVVGSGGTTYRVRKRSAAARMPPRAP